MNANDKLKACKEQRELATKCLLEALKNLLSKGKVSEVKLQKIWLQNMRKHQTLLQDGWYMPPPHGIIVLFGTEKDQSRLNFKCVRSQEWWPRKDIFLDLKGGIVYVYASPVDKDSGIIGDLGLTLYLGKDPRIRKHVQDCYSISQAICNSIKLGMTFKEVYRLALDLIHKRGLTNDILSLSDPTSANIGHTVPASYEDWQLEERSVLQSQEGDKIKDIISKKRRFVNSIETLQVKSGMAFTIEPRLKVISDPKIPLMSYHLIVLFNENGKKEILTGFDDIFKWAKMDYMLTS